MRILHVTSLFAPDRVGGAEIFVESLAREQQALGHDVAVATVSREQQPAWDHHGVIVHPLGHTTPFFILDWARQRGWKQKYYKFAVQRDGGIVARLEKAIEAFRPDVVNTHSLSELTPLIWPMIARRGLPLVHTLHDFTSMCTNGSLFHDGHICQGTSVKCRLFTAFHRRQQKAVNAVTGVGGDVVARHVAAGFFGNVPTDLRRVIWNAIDAPQAPRIRPLPPSDAPVVFGYLARLEPAKGTDIVLDALAHLPRNGWQLTMAGQVPSGDDGYAARAAGRPVTFPGYVDANAFFDEIDCLIVPPIWPEAFGRTVAEACLRGVPVIGSDLAGVAEQVKTSGAGVLFAPGDAEALAARMTEMITDHGRLAIGTGKRGTIATRVSPGHVAREYDDLYAALRAA